MVDKSNEAVYLGRKVVEEVKEELPGQAGMIVEPQTSSLVI